MAFNVVSVKSPVYVVGAMGPGFCPFFLRLCTVCTPIASSREACRILKGAWPSPFCTMILKAKSLPEGLDREPNPKASTGRYRSGTMWGNSTVFIFPSIHNPKAAAAVLYWSQVNLIDSKGASRGLVTIARQICTLDRSSIGGRTYQQRTEVCRGNQLVIVKVIHRNISTVAIRSLHSSSNVDCCGQKQMRCPSGDVFQLCSKLGLVEEVVLPPTGKPLGNSSLDHHFQIIRVVINSREDFLTGLCDIWSLGEPCDLVIRKTRGEVIRRPLPVDPWPNFPKSAIHHIEWWVTRVTNL